MDFNTTKDDTQSTNRAGGKAYTPSSAKERLARLSINNLIEDSAYREDEAALNEVMTAFDAAANEDPEFPMKLAAYCREEQYLRDISQVLMVLSSRDQRTQQYVRDYAPLVIQRADEPATALAVNDMIADGAGPSKPLRKAINDALRGFNEYEFGKYEQNRRDWSMVDVFNVTHPKPKTGEQAVLFERVVRGGLDDYPEVDPIATPHTWETTLSQRGNTAEAWRSVLPDMGLFAIIRNLRNMRQKGLSGEEITGYLDIEGVRASKMWPFRFYQAYKALGDAGQLDDTLSEWLSLAVDETAKNLPDDLGDTYVAVDTSGSMNHPVSDHSNLMQREIAEFFGACLSRKGADVGVFAQDHAHVGVHHDAPTLSALDSIAHKGTSVGGSTNAHLVPTALEREGREYDRLVVLTDMQVWDSTSYGMGSSLRDEFISYRESIESNPTVYCIDLASYGSVQFPESDPWAVQVGGWSESVIDFITYNEDSGLLVDDIESIEPPA